MLIDGDHRLFECVRGVHRSPDIEIVVALDLLALGGLRAYRLLK